MLAVRAAPCNGRRRGGAGQRRTGAGFTLVELVVVMVLVGIVAAIGVGRFFDNKGFQAITLTDRVSGMLRYGQKLAVAQNRPVYVSLASRVALCFDAACSQSQRIAAPSSMNSGSTNTLAACSNATNWECEAAPNGLTITAAVTSFYFDPLGKPFAAGDPYPGATSNFSTLTIRIAGDGSNHDVLVERETGYVH